MRCNLKWSSLPSSLPSRDSALAAWIRYLMLEEEQLSIQCRYFHCFNPYSRLEIMENRQCEGSPDSDPHLHPHPHPHLFSLSGQSRHMNMSIVLWKRIRKKSLKSPTLICIKGPTHLAPRAGHFMEHEKSTSSPQLTCMRQTTIPS
jgi:hypothetical protein